MMPSILINAVALFQFILPAFRVALALFNADIIRNAASPLARAAVTSVIVVMVSSGSDDDDDADRFSKRASIHRLHRDCDDG
jgi:hypothetical protein